VPLSFIRSGCERDTITAAVTGTGTMTVTAAVVPVVIRTAERRFKDNRRLGSGGDERREDKRRV
jgi:hypothetical protein